jgi:hypothetical protein
VQRRCVGAAIGYLDAHENVFGRGLAVLDDHIEISIVRKDARVEQLVLGLIARAPAIGGDEIEIRVGALRILVKPLHVGVRGRGIQVEVVLLDVLPVIAFGVGEPEETLLENRVSAIPQPDRETEALLFVAESREAVFTPAVRT